MNIAVDSADIPIAVGPFRSVFLSRATRSRKDWESLPPNLAGSIKARLQYCCNVKDPFTETPHVGRIKNGPADIFEIRLTSSQKAHRAFAFADLDRWFICTVVPHPKPKDYIAEAKIALSVRTKHFEIVNAKDR